MHFQTYTYKFLTYWSTLSMLEIQMPDDRAAHHVDNVWDCYASQLTALNAHFLQHAQLIVLCTEAVP